MSALYGEDTNGVLNLPSGISLLTAPFQGLDYIMGAMETAYVGAPLPSSTPDITETTQALREGVSQNMTEAGQFFYHAAMSTADSLVAGLMGGGSVGGGIILGMGAASNTAHDVINRGGTAEDALIGGAVSGILTNARCFSSLLCRTVVPSWIMLCGCSGGDAYSVGTTTPPRSSSSSVISMGFAAVCTSPAANRAVKSSAVRSTSKPISPLR